jgi:multidrug efflux pump subunit AcrA (membrane-fusion protein)
MLYSMLKKTIILICLTIALTACKEKAEISEDIRAIKTTTLSIQPLEQIVKISGVVAAVDSSELSFQVNGQVSSVLVDIGDLVKIGQLLATLDPEPGFWIPSVFWPPKPIV